MIALQESKRSLDGTVNGSWDEDSSLGSVKEDGEECGALESADSVDSTSDASGSEPPTMEELNPALEGYALARESALERAWRGTI